MRGSSFTCSGLKIYVSFAYSATWKDRRREKDFFSSGDLFSLPKLLVQKFSRASSECFGLQKIFRSCLAKITEWNRVKMLCWIILMKLRLLAHCAKDLKPFAQCEWDWLRVLIKYQTLRALPTCAAHVNPQMISIIQSHHLSIFLFFSNYKNQSKGMKQWYLLSSFMGDELRDPMFCKQLAKRLACDRHIKHPIRDWKVNNE